MGRAFHDRRELNLRLPDVHRFWVEVLSGRFDVAATIYEARADWEWRAHLLGLAREAPADATPIDHWLAQRPEDALPLSAKGLQVNGQAWNLRTAAPVDQLPAGGLDEFHHRLRKAEKLLLVAARADPTSPIPWMGLLETGLGLQISLREYQYRMEQMAARFPLYSGFASYLQFVSDRWFGSHQEMWEFADSVNASAPEGSPLHAIQAEAAIERFLSQDDLIMPRRALVAEDRLDPLLWAADRSVLHSSFDPDGPAGIRALSSFVVAFERFGCRRLNRHLVPVLRRHWLAGQSARHLRGPFGPELSWRRLSAHYRLTSLLPFRRSAPVARPRSNELA